MGIIHRGDSALDETVKSVAITRLEGMDDDTHGYAAIAAVTMHDRLMITHWKVARDASAVHSLGGIIDLPVREVALTTADAHTITAAIAEDHHLEVRSWGIDFTARGSARGAIGSGVSIASFVKAHGTPQWGLHLTAMRDKNGHLRLDVWRVPLDGTVRHVTDFIDDQGETIEEVKVGRTHYEVTFHPSGATLFELVVRLTSGHVEMQEWVVSYAAPDVPTRIVRFKPPLRIGKAKRIAAPIAETADALAFTAHENEDGELVASITRIKLFGEPAGAGHGRHGRASRVATAPGALNFATDRPGADRLFATAVRDGGGDLKLILWRQEEVARPVYHDEHPGEPIKEVDVVRVLGGDHVDSPRSVLVTAARTANDQLKVTAWRIERTVNEFFSVAFTELRCRETTDDEMSSRDDPYAVFLAVHLDHLDRPRISRTRVFEGVNDEQPDNIKNQSVSILSDDGFIRLRDPDKVIILVTLMESDDSAVNDVVRAALDDVRELGAKLAGQDLPRAEVVARFGHTFGDGILRGAHVPGTASDDDPIGPVKELRLHRADLDAANARERVPRALDFHTPGEPARYRLIFNVIRG
jgi:hypothetical protein